MPSNLFEIIAEPLPGVIVLRTPHFADSRGSFLKGFHAELFNDLGLSFQPAEQFFSNSKKGVLRGMHFQVGMAAQKKLVSCPIGRILDVVVDVRPESANFNQAVAIELSGGDPVAILIAKGYAHGFLTLEDNSWVHYLTTSVHSPTHDKGVLWSSIDLIWPIADPFLSDRDSSHPGIGTESYDFS